MARNLSCLYRFQDLKIHSITMYTRTTSDIGDAKPLIYLNTGANHSKRLPEGASAAVKSSLNKLMTKVKEASARVDKVGS